jgi:hypothetical protein
MVAGDGLWNQSPMGSHDCDIVISGVTYWACYIVMLVEVAKLNEIYEGSMRRDKAFNTQLLLSNF